MTLEYVASVIKIILFDLVLSGDNAVVIGLAAHLLPPRQRRQAMIWGCAMAILMRVLLTLVVAQLLIVPGLRFVGAVLLVWIACKLMQEEIHASDVSRPPPTTLPKAIFRIAMADFIMSLDNVVAIAGASDSDPVRIVLGLLLSISILLFLSALITEIMSRYRWIAYVGAAVLALTAANMMVEDLDVWYKGRWGQHGAEALSSWAAWTLRIVVVLVCVTTNRWWPKPAAVPAGTSAAKQESRPMERVLD
jgi:YjbE family integral membrane protein